MVNEDKHTQHTGVIDKSAQAQSNRQTRLKIRISTLLALTIGGLVAISAGAVLLVSTYANFQNTTELLNTSARDDRRIHRRRYL